MATVRPIHTNLDILETAYVFKQICELFVHTKPVNLLTEMTSFLNCSPEWFVNPSTQIQLKKYVVSNMPGFVRMRP